MLRNTAGENPGGLLQKSLDPETMINHLQEWLLLFLLSFSWSSSSSIVIIIADITICSSQQIWKSDEGIANFDHLITFNSTRHVTGESKSPMFCHRIVIYLLSFLYNFVHIHQVTCSQHTFPQIMAQVQFSMNVRSRLCFLLSQSRGHRWKENGVFVLFRAISNWTKHLDGQRRGAFWL